MNYQHVFEEGKIGHVSLQNRMVMPGMSTRLADSNGEITAQQIRYYEERAKGGVGLIITEFTTIDYGLGKGDANQLRIDDDRFISGFQRLAQSIHTYGAKIFVQLHHAGRQSNSLLTGGKKMVAPSPVTCMAVGEEPRELTTSEVKNLIQRFIAGAYRAKVAGIDGVELHGGHGYLINQFLSPNTNLRTDEYGGSFENRIRFLEEIIVGIKKRCGDDFPVTVRLSVDEFEDGGLNVPLSQKISRSLEKVGADAINASSGNYNTMETVIESPLYEEGWKVYLAEEIKKVVTIPVIAVGNIRDPKYVNTILAEGKADFVAIGRGHLADPEWIQKVADGRENEIKMCISCLHCAYSKGPISCSINPRAGRELEFADMPLTGENKHAVVVGGGPGGLEAARVLTLRGYQVTLFEKGNRLGGQLNLVTDPVYRKKMKRYVYYLCNEVERLAIDVRLNTEASVNLIKSFEPYAVILATGGVPHIPDIEGYDLPNVCNYRDVKLEKSTLCNKKIVVIGSGMVCHSTSRRLVEAGNDVTLIETFTKTGSKITPATRYKLLEKLKKLGVQVITNHHVSKILPNGAIIEAIESKEKVTVTSDHVVIAMGVQTYNPLEKSLKKEIDHVFIIGDAAGHTSLSDATREGFETAYKLESLVSENDRV